MDADVSPETVYRQALAHAVAAREDGEPEQSAAVLQALLTAFPGDAVVTVEYVKTLKKLDRVADAEAALARALPLHPEHFELRLAWAQLPYVNVDQRSILARGRELRRLFDPHDVPQAWETLSVEFDCLYEIGDWDGLEALVERHWDDLCQEPRIFADGAAALQKLFLLDRLRDLADAAAPGVWAHLPAEAPDCLARKLALARQNRAVIEQSGARLISIGQNCLPYQLSGRWGLLGPRADPAALTPFDLGGFTNDSAAGAIETDFAAFADPRSFAVMKAWGGGQMFVHQPSNVGFFHERGQYWLLPDSSRFLTRLALQITNWQLSRRAGKRLYVYCHCGAGDIARLVDAAARHLLDGGAHLLIVNVLGQALDVPGHERVTYRHIPYPPNYDWTRLDAQYSARGFAFESEIIGAIHQCLARLDPAVVAPPVIAAPPPAADLTRDNLVSHIWTFGNENGNVIAERFCFGETGRIEGYRNENEAAWRLDEGGLRIFKENGDEMWRAATVSRDPQGRLHIALRTPLNPDLAFVLAQAEPRPPAAAAPPPPAPLRVLLLDNGLDIPGRLPKSLAAAEIIRIGDIGEADDHPDCDVLIAGLVISHSASAEDAAELVWAIAGRFALCIFFELSCHARDYLKSFGLRSYHEDFSENTGMSWATMDFIAAAVKSASVYKVEHYAAQPAFDSFKPWVVSQNHAPGTMPVRESRGEYKVFDEPAFEFSIFACHRFNAPDLDLAADLTPLDVKTLRFRAQAAGLSFDNIARPEDIGRLIYTTKTAAPPGVAGQTVTLPAPLSGDPVYARPENLEAVTRWRAEFKIDIFDVKVSELQDCIVGGNGGVMSQGRFVWGTDYLLAFMNSSTLDPLLQGLQRRHAARHVPGVAIMGFNALYDNYYHFLVEAMTSISLCADILQRQGTARATIITGKLTPFGRQYMDIFRRAHPELSVVELERDEFITAETLLYCDNLGPPEPPRIVLEQKTFAEKMLAQCGLNETAAGRRVYLARTDTTGRKVLNEQALIDRLRAQDFEIFTAAGKPVPEQMRTFHEAGIIVSPHGAGLTNCLFARPGTKLLELKQANYLNTGLMRVAQRAGVRYHSEMFFDVNHAGQSWAVDIDRVDAAVRRLLEA